MKSFEDIFQSSDSTRDKFLSRIFGIFSEEIVRCWAESPKSPYTDLGRPTLKNRSTPQHRGYTLDFTFKKDGQLYVAEMKCELQYRNYQYLRLKNPSQLHRHKKNKPAFHTFLDIIHNRDQYDVMVNKEHCDVNGAILVWGSCTDAGRDSVMKEYGFHDILSVEEMINDLQTWRDPQYIAFIGKYQSWCSELFNNLLPD